MNIEIYGYEPSQNTAFANALRSLEFDAKMTGLSVYSLENTLKTFKSLVVLSLNKTNQGPASLAIIGFLELLIIKQAEITEGMLLAFQSACQYDPLRDNESRRQVIHGLKLQISSYARDYREPRPYELR